MQFSWNKMDKRPKESKEYNHGERWSGGRISDQYQMDRVYWEEETMSDEECGEDVEQLLFDLGFYTKSAYRRWSEERSSSLLFFSPPVVAVGFRGWSEKRRGFKQRRNIKKNFRFRLVSVRQCPRTDHVISRILTRSDDIRVIKTSDSCSEVVVVFINLFMRISNFN